MLIDILDVDERYASICCATWLRCYFLLVIGRASGLAHPINSSTAGRRCTCANRAAAVGVSAKLDAGSEVTIVDVRNNLLRDVDIIPGALRIPIEDLAARHNEVPRD